MVSRISRGGGGGVQEGEERAESRNPKVAGTGRNCSNLATFCNRNGTERWEALQKEAGSGSKRCGSREV